MTLDSVIPGLIGTTLFGGIALYFGRLAILARRSRRWPSVPGKIVSSQVRRWRPARYGAQSSTWYHAPEVRYAFDVDGKEYHGTAVCFGRNWDTNGASARETVARYPVHARIQVRYAPNRPSQAILEPRASSRVYLFFAIAAGMTVSIMYGVVMGV